MKTRALSVLAAIFVFNSCTLTPPVTSKADIISNIKLCDNSYVGLLCFFNFSGTVENNNRYTVKNIELEATLYNKETKVRSFQKLMVSVPVTAYGSATYSSKVFVGGKMEVERVKIVSAEWY